MTREIHFLTLNPEHFSTAFMQHSQRGQDNPYPFLGNYVAEWPEFSCKGQIVRDHSILMRAMGVLPIAINIVGHSFINNGIIDPDIIRKKSTLILSCLEDLEIRPIAPCYYSANAIDYMGNSDWCVHLPISKCANAMTTLEIADPRNNGMTYIQMPLQTTAEFYNPVEQRIFKINTPLQLANRKLAISKLNL